MLSAAPSVHQEHLIYRARVDVAGQGRETWTFRTCCARLGMPPAPIRPACRALEKSQMVPACLGVPADACECQLRCRRARSRRCGRGPGARGSSSTSRRSLCRRAPPAAASSGSGGRSNRLLHSTSLRGVQAATVRRDLRAIGCESDPACAETGVQRGEMCLSVCGSCSGSARSAACMSTCVHGGRLTGFASVTIWMHDMCTCVTHR